MKKIVTIPPGTSTFLIGLTLQEEKLIYSPTLFVLYTKFLKVNKKIQAGRYEFNTSMSMAEIVHDMEKGGKANEMMITIPEGYTLEQIASLLDSKSIVSEKNFKEATQEKSFLDQMKIHRDTIEGYLFPDTYEMVFQMNPDRAIEMMLNRFEEVALPIYNKYANRTNLTLDQAVILASIIEKEAGERSEMRLISSVFHNRLKRKMPLQSEATVRYATKKFSQIITMDDLRLNSPYNTYRHMGLPYGPISNPGASAIEAALNPEKSKYFYFVAKNDNTHAFSMTLAQHNAAVAKYRYLNSQNNQ